MGKNVNKLHKDGSLFCLELSSGLMDIIRGPNGLRSQASQYKEMGKSHVPVSCSQWKLEIWWSLFLRALRLSGGEDVGLASEVFHLVCSKMSV